MFGEKKEKKHRKLFQIIKCLVCIESVWERLSFLFVNGL